jgi:hypothetical protein
LYILFFGLCGVGIHNEISKNYHMSDIALISRKICDNNVAYNKADKNGMTLGPVKR